MYEPNGIDPDRARALCAGGIQTCTYTHIALRVPTSIRNQCVRACAYANIIHKPPVDGALLLYPFVHTSFAHTAHTHTHGHIARLVMM